MIDWKKVEDELPKEFDKDLIFEIECTYENEEKKRITYSCGSYIKDAEKEIRFQDQQSFYYKLSKYSWAGAFVTKKLLRWDYINKPKVENEKN